MECGNNRWATSGVGITIAQTTGKQASSLKISILKSYENLNCTQTPNQSTSQFVHVESKGSATLFVNLVWAELSLLMTPTKTLTLT